MSKSNSIPQTGILIVGEGAKRLNALQSNLCTLTLDQLDLLNQAKKYANEQSVKVLHQKHGVSNQKEQQKATQRHQALILMCRVYVGSISFEMREDTVKAAFEEFGAVKSCSMSWDQVTNKHKGFAFVEYEIPEAAQLALVHMNSKQLCGRAIKVGRPSNMPQAAPVIDQIQAECKESNRIYVANVHENLSEQELSNLFDPFGPIRSCKLALTPNVDQPQHRGYGFIEYESDASATEAIEAMDNLDLGDRVLHVCRATTPSENVSIYGTLENELVSLVTTGGGSQPNDIDDTQVLSNEHNNNSSTKLDRSPTSHRPSHEHSLHKARETETDLGDSAANDDDGASNVLVLRNMVTDDEELDDSLLLDIHDECGKHGVANQVVIYIDKERSQQDQAATQVNQVKIFIKYCDVGACRRARQALNGRFFAGRRVSADYYDKDSFRNRDLSK